MTPQGWYRYTLNRPLSADEEKRIVRPMAGPVYLGHKQEIVVHENCAWLVERQLLPSLGVSATRLVKPKPVNPFDRLPHLPELREWVPGFLAPFQVEFLLKMGPRDAVFGIMPTGSGKSVQGITYGLLHRGPGGSTPKVLIITRAAARRTLAGEVRKYTTLEPFLIEGEKAVEIPADARFVVVGWELLLAHTPAILRWAPMTVIMDESHMAANHKRREAYIPRDEEEQSVLRTEEGVAISFRKLQNRFAAAEDIARAVPYRCGMTATPVRDRLRNVWGQVDLITNRGFGTFYDFAARYCNSHVNPWGGINTDGKGTPEAMEELAARVSFFTYYVPHSVTHRDLPPKRRQVTYIKADELSTGRDVLTEVREHGFNTATGEAWAKLAHAAAMKRPRVVEEAVAGAFRAPEGRGGGKVCVFTGLRKDAVKIAAEIEKATKARKSKAKDAIEQQPVQVWCAHGGLTPKQRDAIREEYMAHPGPCVLVATGDSMGESVNLHDTDLAIIAMLPWTPGQIRQWEGRWVRLGMTRPVLIMYLVAEGTADEHVAFALLSKLPAVEAIAKDEVLISLSKDLRGDEAEIEAGLLAKLLAPAEGEEDDDDDEGPDEEGNEGGAPPASEGPAA